MTPPQTPSQTPSPTPAMASLVLQDVTHQLVQQFMAELEDLLPALIEGGLSEAPSKVLQKIITFFDEEMKSHHGEEERQIFPALLSQGDAALRAKVQQLQSDHDALRSGWRELKEGLTWAARVGAGEAIHSGVSLEASLRASFERYSTCFARHLVLEESIQFSPDTASLFQRWDSAV